MVTCKRARLGSESASERGSRRTTSPDRLRKYRSCWISHGDNGPSRSKLETTWLVNGFRASGLSPFKPDAMDCSKCCASAGSTEAQGSSGPQAPDVASPSMPFLIELQERMTHEHLTVFNENVGDQDGPRKMRDLYNNNLISELQRRNFAGYSVHLSNNPEGDILAFCASPSNSTGQSVVRRWLHCPSSH